MFFLSLFILLAQFLRLSKCFGAAISEITPAEWHALNASVDGKLYLGRPMAFPCYTSYGGIAKPVNRTACAEIGSNKRSLSYIGDQYGGFVQANWGVCQATNGGCPISSNSTTDHIVGNCDQGSVPYYYIDVREVSHVMEGLKFANKHEIQVVIKNSGHDYKGRSSAPHALGLWLHNYHPPITLEPQFTPEGCNSPVGKVVTFGAGQGFDGIYKFAEDHNVTVVGGSSATVGAAGGWIAGGGHGALSPVFGLGVDNVQQFRVVLPNGTFITTNRCQNRDIFFALRGGGGGTFGVVMEMSTLAHRQVTVQWANITLPTLEPSQSRQFHQILVSNANRWAAEGWGGYSYPIMKRSLQFINPHLDASKAADSLKPLLDFANSLREKAEIDMRTYPSWYPLYADHIAPTETNTGNRGAAMSSRLVPSSNFEGIENQNQLVDVLIESASSQVGLMLLMVAPNRTLDDDSSVTPAWRKATWHVIMLKLWDPANTTIEATEDAFKTVNKAMNPLRALTPTGGAYINEADTFEPDFVDSFWGQENYERLLRIKNDIDPKKVLQVHQGIGWNPKTKIFKCYPKNPNPLIGSKDEL